MKLHAVAVILVVLLPSFSSAQTSDKPTLSSITLNSSTNLIGEVRSENPVSIVVFDLNTGEEKTIKKTDLKGRTTATDTQAISRVGLPRFLAWRISKAINGPTTGKIAEVTPAMIYLTLGEKDGIEVGKTISVFRDQGDLKDPDTGNVIGKKRSKLAKLEVTEVTDSYSKAKVLGDLEVELKVGDLVEQDGINQAVAILPILDVEGEETTPGKSLIEQITTVVVSRGISVVDRQRLDDTLGELALQQSKDFDQATAQKVGRQLGAFAILTGTITPKGNRAEAHVRLIRVETGEIIVAGVQDLGLNTGTTNPTSTSPKTPIAATGKPVVYSFTKEKDVSESWQFSTDQGIWSVTSQGLWLRLERARACFALSRFSIDGDCQIYIDCETRDGDRDKGFEITLFGEKYQTTSIGFHRLVLTRKADALEVNDNGTITSFSIKESNLKLPSTIQIRNRNTDIMLKRVQVQGQIVSP